MKLNTVVIGSCGFIGSHVVRKLIALGHAVIGVDCFEGQVHGRNRIPEDHNLFLMNGGQFEFPKFNQTHVVIHLGAKVGVGQSMYQIGEYVESNSFDTATMLDNLRANPPKKLIVASSMSIYGEGANHLGNPYPTAECRPPNLTSVYALTKYDQEQLCLIFGKAYGVQTTALRFFNTYGAGQSLNNPYTGVMAIFASRLLNDKPPIIFDDGEQSRDFIHVDDVANAVVQAATTDMAGVYNVGTGVGTSVKRVAELLAENLGKDIAPEITGKKRVGDIRHCYADTTKIRATGWKPMIRLEDGLKEYAEWLLTQPKPEDKFQKAAQELIENGLVKA